MGIAMTEFDQWWAHYPRREAKLNAIKAYAKARKLASAADLLAGLERWKQTMPQDRQFQPLPASWLNAGRWMDDSRPSAVPSCTDWYAECQQQHGGACGGQFRHHTRLMMDAQRAKETAS
jgi:hypothetical protein